MYINEYQRAVPVLLYFRMCKLWFQLVRLTRANAKGCIPTATGIDSFSTCHRVACTKCLKGLYWTWGSGWRRGVTHTCCSQHRPRQRRRTPCTRWCWAPARTPSRTSGGDTGLPPSPQHLPVTLSQAPNSRAFGFVTLFIHIFKHITKRYLRLYNRLFKSKGGS